MTLHFEILVEEPSMEAFLRAALPRLLPEGRTFEVYPFQGKSDLLTKLDSRLNSYAHWLPDDWRVIVLIDRDNENCHDLKGRLEHAAETAGMLTRSRADNANWRVVNRIVIEELEAWYFGDWMAAVAAYPRLPQNIPRHRDFRDPDNINGGTWEAIERIFGRSGYFNGGLRKIEAARAIGANFDAARCNSPSFKCFWSAICESPTQNSEIDINGVKVAT